MKADIGIDAFSGVYPEYETLSRENFIDQARRTTIRRHVEKYLHPKDKILELNAGSGIDALYFAEKGHEVLATDISETAGRFVAEKASRRNLDLQFAQCSFTEIASATDKKFNHIFSNFGGLNCTDALEKTFAQFSPLLHLDGFVTLVVMPKIYPWEILSGLRGNRSAMRRFARGQMARVASETIPVFYHSPGDIKRAFPDNFRHVSTRNIGTFYPSAHFESLQRYEKTIKKLIKFDDAVNRSWLMPKGIGDYFIITFQKTR